MSKTSDFDQISYFDDEPADGQRSEASVRRLGMSAILEETAADEVAISALSGKLGKESDTPAETGSLPRQASLDPARDPHLQPDPNALLRPEKVAVGDRITVVTPDGLSYVYRVTARDAADEGEDATLDRTKLGQPAPIDANCTALNNLVAGAYRLVIESVQANNSGHRTPGEQKL
ncbi:hypothetical protein [Methyloligella solikamskensis]|uniref:Uncharacterized protein n=1 Tax=Methyloligella solikamskensis TaxID=1177756 RepID=A0ABW3J8F3_9HYPH